ncbi:MAG TPA: hypothetical protein VMB34_03505 [Acetobacteraceae bacterium]|nr:hypothetical protein [Acetobacteraceae bacterium]
MGDINHQWGSDLNVAANGDIAVVTGPSVGQQRVLRRLLTSALDYIWQPTYGAGVARFVGEPANALQIRAVIRSQIFKEQSVAQTPEPTINVNVNPGEVASTAFVEVFYTDVQTGQTQVLAFSVGN